MMYKPFLELTVEIIYIASFAVIMSHKAYHVQIYRNAMVSSCE